MPKAKKSPAPPVQPVAPVAPVAPAPPPPAPAPAVAAQVKPSRQVVYDKVEITEHSTTSQHGPLTVSMLKKIFGWETEKEYQQRKVVALGGKPEHYLFGNNFHCKNVAAEKVRLNYNTNNRPFDEEWCQRLIHMILYGQWAGPHAFPGETVNGETIRISRYGDALSGQHQATACILAGEWLLKARQDGQDPPDDPKYPMWRSLGEPFLETILVTGVSDDPRVVLTVDYVKPRSVADMFYTSDVFRSCTTAERKELCKLLATAVDVLWTRTDTRGYKTHPEIVAFLDRHKRLLRCVEHLFGENRVAANRRISRLRLSPGVCAGLMYLMGSSGSPDPEYGDMYRNEVPPSEKNLDWSLWDKAEEFWTLLTSGPDFRPVCTALARLVDSSVADDTNQGMGGRAGEKLAVIAKAWDLWKDHPDTAGPPFSNDDLAPGGALCLSYSNLDDKGKKLPDGEIKLIDGNDFEGIDSPVKTTARAAKSQPPDPPPPSGEEFERLKADALARRQPAKK